MRALPAVAAAMVALLADPARAADPAQLDCPLAALTATERLGLDQYIAEQGVSEDSRWLAFIGAVDRCAARFSWSESARADAANYAFTAEALVVTRRLFGERGIEIGELERALLADPTVAAVTGAPADREVIFAFVTRNAELIGRLLGQRSPDDPVLRAVGLFVFARAIHDKTRSAFIAD